jgi:hypothetical protein
MAVSNVRDGEAPADAAPSRASHTAPVPLPALIAGLAVVPAVVLALASTGSWLGVAGVVAVLAGMVAVIVVWSGGW